LPIAITAEQLALQASIREWAKRADTIEAVRSHEPRDAVGPATSGLSIAGGTTPTMLSLIGERLLGLPWEETR
jgi:hypothetical protein